MRNKPVPAERQTKTSPSMAGNEGLQKELASLTKQLSQEREIGKYIKQAAATLLSHAYIVMPTAFIEDNNTA